MDETQFNKTNFVLLKEGKILEFNQQRKFQNSFFK